MALSCIHEHQQLMSWKCENGSLEMTLGRLSFGVVFFAMVVASVDTMRNGTMFTGPGQENTFKIVNAQASRGDFHSNDQCKHDPSSEQH